jgi:hypothetical protein
MIPARRHQRLSRDDGLNHVDPGFGFGTDMPVEGTGMRRRTTLRHYTFGVSISLGDS